MRMDSMVLVENHQGIIHQQAWAWAQKFDVDQNELYSFGRSELIRVIPRWNPARGKFTTFLTWVLHNSFQDYIRKHRREEHMDPALLPEVPATVSPSRTHFIGEVVELVEGWDAVEVIEVVEQLMDECALNEREMNRTQMKRAITLRLREEKGWRMPRIMTAFRELSNVIGGM